MRASSLTVVLVAAAAMALPLSGCAPAASCTVISHTPSGVVVHLGDVLDIATGPHTGQICLGDQATCTTAPVPAPDARPGDQPTLAVVGAPSTDAPLTVRVTVRDGGGAVVYTASGTHRPSPTQLESSACSPVHYVLTLVATPAGTLDVEQTPAGPPGT